jgi:multiple sugar transport system substrate-binding protein
VKKLLFALVITLCVFSWGFAGGSGQSSGQTVLNIWNPEESPACVEALRVAAAAFEAENPGVKVELSMMPWNDIYTKWMSGIETGTVPDVSVASAAFAQSLNSVGALEPLDDIVSPDFFADSAKSFVEANKFNGRLIAMPFVQNCCVLWYRTRALQEKGIAVPKTWDELLSAAQKLTGNGQYGILLTASRSHLTQHSFYTLMLSNGGDITDRTSGTQNLFNSPANLETLKFYTELAKYSPPGSLGYERPDAESAMATGKINMFVYGSWLASSLMNNAPEVFKEFSVAPVPVNKGRGAFMGNLSVVAFKQGKNIALAKKFISFFMQNKYYLPWIFADPAGNIPVTKSAQNSSEYRNNPLIVAMRDKIDVVLQELPYAWIYGVPNPNAGELEGLSTITYATTRVLIEKMTPENALRVTADEVGQILNKK